MQLNPDTPLEYDNPLQFVLIFLDFELGSRHIKSKVRFTFSFGAHKMLSNRYPPIVDRCYIVLHKPDFL